MQFVIDTYIVWFTDPQRLVRALIERAPSRILDLGIDSDGRYYYIAPCITH